jgi:DNA-binding MarR family transcriptional regulator
MSYVGTGRTMTRLHLNIVERKVLCIFQEEKSSLLASYIAERIGYDTHAVMKAFETLAEDEILTIVDRTAGELTPFGMTYDLFDDDSLSGLSLRRDTEIILELLLNDPHHTVSRKELESHKGFTPEEIERAIDELEDLGYPMRSRVKP